MGVEGYPVSRASVAQLGNLGERFDDRCVEGFLDLHESDAEVRLRCAVNFDDGARRRVVDRDEQFRLAPGLLEARNREFGHDRVARSYEERQARRAERRVLDNGAEVHRADADVASGLLLQAVLPRESRSPSDRVQATPLGSFGPPRSGG